jgi:putative selenate reductase
VTFDCITCDKCIPVCPNDANFTYHTGEVRITYRDVEISPDGSAVPIGDEREFKLEKADQIANFADYCNHCGNCDTFCPEYDGPYLKKPNFYGSRQAFEAGAPYDGFLVERMEFGIRLSGRVEGRLCQLEQLADVDTMKYYDGSMVLSVGVNQSIQLDVTSPRITAPHVVDVGRLIAMQILLRGITDPTRIHSVNTPLLEATEG